MKKMKKNLAAAIIAAALTAVSMSSVVYANDVDTMTFDDLGGSKWSFTGEDIKPFVTCGADGEVVHFELKEVPEGSMIYYFNFVFGDKNYELMYILMQPEQVMDIPVAEIINALSDRYPDESFNYAELTKFEVCDTASFTADVYIHGAEAVISAGDSDRNPATGTGLASAAVVAAAAVAAAAALAKKKD